MSDISDKTIPRGTSEDSLKFSIFNLQCSMTTIETTDLFRSAYLLALGADLIEIREPECPLTLVFRGERVEQWNQAYQRGQALVNPVRLQECLQQINDELSDRF